MLQNYKGYNVKIEQDDMGGDGPRDWDNLGVMLCSHKRYLLGDIKESKAFPWDNFSSWSEVESHLIKTQDIAAMLPLYLYDHSGITMNTTGFNCRFDSGRVGVIFITKTKAKVEYGWKMLNAERVKKLQELLRGEVATYDKYLTGDVWWFEIKDKEGNFIDSCGGYYGYDEVEKEVKSIIDNHAEQMAKAEFYEI